VLLLRTEKKIPFQSQSTVPSFGTPAKGEGNEMAQWDLKANGRVVPRRTCCPLTVAKKHLDQEQKKRTIFDGLIERRWGTSINPPKPDPDNKEHNEYEEYEDDIEVTRTVPDNEDSVDGNGLILNQLPAYDKIIHSEVALQLGESTSTGKVMQRALGQMEGQRGHTVTTQC
jgi:hypothetical protein